jgi:hypothetical protein
MDQHHFKIGGLNISGFAIVDYDSPAAKHFIEKWLLLDSRQWPGAGQRWLKVGTALLV